MKIKVKAGDFKKAEGAYSRKEFFLSKGWFSTERIKISNVDSIEVRNQNEEYKAGRVIGAGALGVVALGPIGGLAGILAGKKQMALVAIHFKDGRKILFETDGGTLKKMVEDLEEVNF